MGCTNLKGTRSAGKAAQVNLDLSSNSEEPLRVFVLFCFFKAAQSDWFLGEIPCLVGR